MRILHIGKLFHPSHGGIETFLMDVAKASHSKGLQQGILVHAATGQKPGSGDAKNYPFLDYIERVPTWGNLAYAPISPGFPRALSRAIGTFKPNVLHLHLPNPSAFWVLLSPSARKIPCVVHWHADAFDPSFDLSVKALYRIYRPFEQALLRHARTIIASSRPYRDSSLALRPHLAKCQVVPLGLDTSRLAKPSVDTSDQAVDQSTTRPLKIVALGRLTGYKGFGVLIEALRGMDAEAVIVGEGQMRGELERYIRDHGLQAQIRLMGAVDDETRNRLLSESDLVCLPSLNRAEAFGLSVLEAMAMGKATLVSDIEGSGLPWLVEHEKTGWHVPPGDPLALRQMIVRLSQERERLDVAGQKGRARFDEHFEIQKITEMITDIQKGVAQASLS